MCSSVLAPLLGIGISVLASNEAELKRFQYAQIEMAVSVRIILYTPTEEIADRAAEAVFKRIRQLNGVLSDYDPDSELRRLCNTSGDGNAVRVSDDLWHVISQSQLLSERSGGAFDATVGPVVRLWRRARRISRLPSTERLDAARELVGYEFVQLDPKRRTVQLKKPDMRLDLGGIAKGYVVDETLAVLARHGVTRALVDAGGDIGMGAPPPDKPGWLIGVEPLERNSKPSRYLWLSNSAIATSGDTWQYVEIDGARYSHIVDPRTGIGLTDHSSVTIIAPNCTTADGLASAVSVLGPEGGLKLVDQTPGAAAFIVRAPDGQTETYKSRRWKEFPTAEVDEQESAE